MAFTLINNPYKRWNWDSNILQQYLHIIYHTRQRIWSQLCFLQQQQRKTTIEEKATHHTYYSPAWNHSDHQCILHRHTKSNQFQPYHHRHQIQIKSNHCTTWPSQAQNGSKSMWKLQTPQLRRPPWICTNNIRRDNKEFRTSICHQDLLVVLGSSLNKSGHLQIDIYISRNMLI